VVIWYIFFPFWYVWTKINLATLLQSHHQTPFKRSLPSAFNAEIFPTKKIFIFSKYMPAKLPSCDNCHQLLCGIKGIHNILTA
jgi:hypothetical protein